MRYYGAELEQLYNIKPWIGPITIKFYLTHINYFLSYEPIMHIRRGGKNNSIV